VMFVATITVYVAIASAAAPQSNMNATVGPRRRQQGQNSAVCSEIFGVSAVQYTLAQPDGSFHRNEGASHSVGTVGIARCPASTVATLDGLPSAANVVSTRCGHGGVWMPSIECVENSTLPVVTTPHAAGTHLAKNTLLVTGARMHTAWQSNNFVFERTGKHTASTGSLGPELRSSYDAPNSEYADGNRYRIYWSNTVGGSCASNLLDGAHEDRLVCDAAIKSGVVTCKDFSPTGPYAHYCDFTCDFHYCDWAGSPIQSVASGAYCLATNHRVRATATNESDTNSIFDVQQPDPERCLPAAPCAAMPSQGWWVLDHDDDPSAIDAYYPSADYQVPTGPGWLESCDGRFVNSSIVIKDVDNVVRITESLLLCILLASFLASLTMLRWDIKSLVVRPQCLDVDARSCNFRCTTAVTILVVAGMCLSMLTLYLTIICKRQLSAIRNFGTDYYLVMVADDAMGSIFARPLEPHVGRAHEAVTVACAVGSCGACFLHYVIYVVQ
jgi:hypothetical protein